MKKMEEVAIATALRNVLVPRLLEAEDRSLVATFVMDLWPNAEIDFGLEEEEKIAPEVEQICVTLTRYWLNDNLSISHSMNMLCGCLIDVDVVDVILLIYKNFLKLFNGFA